VDGGRLNGSWSQWIERLVLNAPRARREGALVQYLAASTGSIPIVGSTGIPSGEAFGVGTVIGPLYISGSAGIYEGGMGTGWLTFDQIVSGSAGIPSGETFGVGSMSGPIVGSTGIPSGEAFGTGTILPSVLIGSAGIPSEEAFGTDAIIGFIGGPLIGSTGIPSGETFGVGVIAGPVTGFTGIASSEAFGSGGAIAVRISGSAGIPSAELFGSGGRLGYSIRGVQGIESGEFVGRNGAVLALSTTNSNYNLYLSGRDRTPYLRVGSLNIDCQINFNAAARFELYAADGAYTPAVGERVLIQYYDDGTWRRIFAGTIETVEYYRVPHSTHQFASVSATDYGRALSRRLVNMKFPAANFGSLNSILSWIEQRFLLQEGLTWKQYPDPGVQIGDLEFSYAPLNEVLTKLAEICNLQWMVDFDGNLHVADFPSMVQLAPIELTEDTTGPNSQTWRDLVVRRSRGLYRNVQFVKSTFTVTSRVVTETYVVPINEFAVEPVLIERFFDGYFLKDRRYFGNVLKVNRIWENGVEVPFRDPYRGINPPNPKWELIWENDIQLYQAYPRYEPLPNGSTLTIEFVVRNDAPPAVEERDSSEISYRSSIEGGSGIYEAYEEVFDVEDPASVQAIAQALLERFGKLGLEVEFETLRFGLFPGQRLPANLPSYGVEEDLTIESTSMRELSPRVLSTQVKASNIIQQRDALAAFQRLVRKLRRAPQRTYNEIVFVLAETIPGITNPGLTTGTNMTSPYPLRSKMTLVEVSAIFKQPPQGADILINIRADGQSIFPSGVYLRYPAGETGTVSQTSFRDAPLTLNAGTVLTIDVVQIGTTFPGMDGTVVVRGAV